MTLAYQDACFLIDLEVMSKKQDYDLRYSTDLPGQRHGLI